MCLLLFAFHSKQIVVLCLITVTTLIIMIMMSGSDASYEDVFQYSRRALKIGGMGSSLVI